MESNNAIFVCYMSHILPKNAKIGCLDIIGHQQLYLIKQPTSKIIIIIIIIDTTLCKSM